MLISWAGHPAIGHSRTFLPEWLLVSIAWCGHVTISARSCHVWAVVCPADGAVCLLLLQAVGEVERRYPKGLPLLSAEEDMSVDDPAYRKAERCVK